MKRVVLLRHGESVWNKENRFTGWTDVDLTERGIQQARKAGHTLKNCGYTFDIAYSSYLKRAIKSLWYALDAMDLNWIPSEKTWKLNERHYGSLQGLNKDEIIAHYGLEQVQKWRRDPYETPPPLEKNDPRYPGLDSRYKELSANDLPLTENLNQTMKRTLAYWDNVIVPQIKQDKKVILVAHGNSLRSLIQHIDSMADESVVSLEIEIGIPLVYELDDDLNPLTHYYIKD